MLKSSPKKQWRTTAGSMWDDVIKFVSMHPYLCESLAGLCVYLIIYAGIMETRRIQIIGSLAALVMLPTYLVYEGYYWSPVRLGGLGLGIEDVLVLFVLGGTNATAAALPFRRTLSIDFQLRQFIGRAAALTLIYAVTLVLPWLLGADPLTSSIAANLIILVIMIILRQDLWPFALSGFLIFAPSYLIFLKTTLLIFPDFLFQWNLSAFWGTTIAGLPAGEIAWVFTIAPAAPWGLAYCLGDRFAL